MDSSRLTELQKDFLRLFFSREQRFFLSGGAALAGFHLGHRDTHDLDLFTLADVLHEGAAVMNEVGRELAGTVEAIQTSPDFRRFLLQRASDALVIDLIRERVIQIANEKPVIHGIRVDPPEEIMANKLCALLSRSELRDLIDLRALEQAGYRLNDALAAAAAKDAGLTPAQLAWVLRQLELGEDPFPLGGVSAEELQSYLDDLIVRLTRLAFPG